MAKSIAQEVNEFESDNALTELVHKKLDTVVGMPSWQGGVESDTQICLDKLCHFNIINGNHISTCKASSAIIAENRNNIIREAIKADAKYVLFMDTDMVFPHSAIQLMQKWNKPVISALAFAKSYPFNPNMYDRIADGGWKPIRNWKTRTENNTPLVKVDCVGGAFMLIKVSALKKIDPPWFASPSIKEHLLMQECDKFINSKVKDEVIVDRIKNIMKEWKSFGLKDHEVALLGEDYYFSEKCRLKRIPIYVDTSLKLGHIGKFTYSYASFDAANDQGVFEKHSTDIGKTKKKRGAA